jgi:hypothetical protein
MADSREQLLVGIEESGHVFFQLNGEIFADSAVAEGLLALEIITTTGKTLRQYLDGIEREQGALFYNRGAVPSEWVNSEFQRGVLRIREASASEFAARLAEVLGKPLAAAASGKIVAGTGFDTTDPNGILVKFADGTWAMYRNSGTEPVVRIYGEETTRERLQTQEQAVATVLRGMLKTQAASLGASSARSRAGFNLPGQPVTGGELSFAVEQPTALLLDARDGAISREQLEEMIAAAALNPRLQVIIYNTGSSGAELSRRFPGAPNKLLVSGDINAAYAQVKKGTAVISISKGPDSFREARSSTRSKVRFFRYGAGQDQSGLVRLALNLGEATARELDRLGLRQTGNYFSAMDEMLTKLSDAFKADYAVKIAA